MSEKIIAASKLNLLRGWRVISADNSLLRHLTIKYKKLDTETEYFKEKNNNEKKK